MDVFINNLHNFLFVLVELTTNLIEIGGVLIIVVTLVKEVYNMIFVFKFNFLKINEDNNLSASLAIALEVLLAAEILKTITIADYRTLVIIGVLIFLRIAITLLLFWKASHKEEIESQVSKKHIKEE